MFSASTAQSLDFVAHGTKTDAVVHPFKAAIQVAGREYVAPQKTPKMLRRGDRFFAMDRAGAFAWFEVDELLSDGYTAHFLDRSDCAAIKFNSNVANESWAIAGVDVGPRFAPAQHVEAIAFFTNLFYSGKAFTFESFLNSAGNRTNQIHFNSHAQALACLAHGQYFVCGLDIWVVVQCSRSQILGRRLKDEALSYFSRTGVSENLPGVKISAAVRAEAPYRAGGWELEVKKAVAEGICSSRLFCLSPGSLSSAVIGTSLVLNAGLGLHAEKWVVTDRDCDDLRITSGNSVGVINVISGEGHFGAKGRCFLAVLVDDDWGFMDLTTAIDQALRFS